MRLAVILPFLNEEDHLPLVLPSLLGQDRPADRIVLLDDGSTDRSAAIAQEFADAEPSIRLLRRPARDRDRDRLSAAAEYQAFQWAVEQLDGPYDVVAKLDSDIELTPATFSTVLARLESDPGLGVAGTYTCELEDGRWRRERHPRHHVRGGTKYYRWAVYEQCGPIPAILGWDTIDDLSARAHGWRTESLEVPTGDPRHHRRSGSYDGVVRAYRRWGHCAWAYGASFPFVLVVGAERALRRPRLIGGVNYVYGYVKAALARAPRAAREVRAQQRKEERTRLREALGWR